MIDASFTVAPCQRNTKEENKTIKEGKGDDLWNDKPNKKRYKNINRRWTKKNGERFYGYKNHAKIDTKSKLINKYAVTDTSAHDSRSLDDLDKNQELLVDSAYTGEEQDKTITKYEMKNKVREKGYNNKPLIEKLRIQKIKN